MRAITILLFALLGLPSMLLSQEHSTSLHYLQLPATTKTLALGGVTTTIVANDVALALESPALFGKEQNGQLSMSYMNYLQSHQLGNVFYGRSISDNGSWGIGARYIHYGSMQGRDLDGIDTGTFSAQDISLQTSYSYELTDRLRAGISLKLLYSSIEQYTAWGVGVDLGINYFSQSRERSVGITLVNLGTLVKPYTTTRENLPWDIRIGWSQRLSHAPFQLHLTLYNLHRLRTEEITPELSGAQKALRHLAIGIEYVPSNKFWLALGYNPRLAQNLKSFTGAKLGGFSAGLGFDRSGYRVGLAATSYNGGMWALMATFSTDFGFSI